MAMTAQTVNITTQVFSDSQTNDFAAKIAEMKAQGLTDGFLSVEGTSPNPVTYTRRFLDEASAGIYQDWLVNYAATQGYSYISMIIEPFVESV